MNTATVVYDEKTGKYYYRRNDAEVNVINQAMNAGVNLKDLHMTTIHTTKSSFGKDKEACENCKKVFKGKIKQNYTGWIGDDKK